MTKREALTMSDRVRGYVCWKITSKLRPITLYLTLKTDFVAHLWRNNGIRGKLID